MFIDLGFTGISSYQFNELSYLASPKFIKLDLVIYGWIVPWVGIGIKYPYHMSIYFTMCYFA